MVLVALIAWLLTASAWLAASTLGVVALLGLTMAARWIGAYPMGSLLCLLAAEPTAWLGRPAAWRAGRKRAVLKKRGSPSHA